MDSRNHPARAERLHEKDEWHYRQDVMMGGEGCEPVHGEIADPDDEDWKVDWENPEHEDQDRVRIIVKVVVDVRTLG